MAAIQERSDGEAGSPVSVTGRWRERLDDPLNRFYRYPLARLLVRGLVKTPVTPNQVTFVQPLLAGAAGYLITFPGRGHLVAGALLFELRAVLDCADGTLARARGRASAGGHAIDGIADWLATLLLYAGIFWHFRLHPPPAGAWSHYLSVGGILLLALAQGALRSFAADHYKLKYTSIFEHGRDGTVAALCRKVDALGPESSIFARVDVLIARAEHLAFEHERFDPSRAAGVRGAPAADGAPHTPADARLAVPARAGGHAAGPRDRRAVERVQRRRLPLAGDVLAARGAPLGGSALLRRGGAAVDPAGDGPQRPLRPGRRAALRARGHSARASFRALTTSSSKSISVQAKSSTRS